MSMLRQNGAWANKHCTSFYVHYINFCAHIEMLFTEAHFCTSKLILNACYRSFRRSNNNTIKGLSLSIRWAKLSDDASCRQSQHHNWCCYWWYWWWWWWCESGNVHEKCSPIGCLIGTESPQMLSVSLTTPPRARMKVENPSLSLSPSLSPSLFHLLEMTLFVISALGVMPAHHVDFHFRMNTDDAYSQFSATSLFRVHIHRRRAAQILHRYLFDWSVEQPRWSLWLQWLWWWSCVGWWENSSAWKLDAELLRHFLFGYATAPQRPIGHL